MIKTGELQEIINAVRAEIGKVIIGQHDVVDLAMVTIFSRSHALIEGVPGLAKTLLIRTIAQIIDCDNKRIQFTPDLMPADITGTSVYNMKENSFNLMKGPVFTGLLLADEINRAPAKTQAALLQCMQERVVTIDNITHILPYEFTVFATQNPIEYAGTYPLPEAQKDRFLLKIDMGYPTLEEEKLLARGVISGETPEKIVETGQLNHVISPEKLPKIHAAFNQVTIKEELVEYIIKIVRSTREHNAILVGAGPRATQALIMSSRVFATLEDRDFVIPDDIKALAVAVLGHRLILRPEYELEGLSVNEVIKQILTDTIVPR
jgi:MoxR-like ATPase